MFLCNDCETPFFQSCNFPLFWCVKDNFTRVFYLWLWYVLKKIPLLKGRHIRIRYQSDFCHHSIFFFQILSHKSPPLPLQCVYVAPLPPITSDLNVYKIKAHRYHRIYTDMSKLVYYIVSSTLNTDLNPVVLSKIYLFVHHFITIQTKASPTSSLDLAFQFSVPEAGNLK